MSQKSNFFQLSDFCFPHLFAFGPPRSSTVIFWTVPVLSLVPLHSCRISYHSYREFQQISFSLLPPCTWAYVVGFFCNFPKVDLSCWPHILDSWSRCIFPTAILVLRVHVCISNNSPATNRVLHSCQIAVYHSSSTWWLSLHITQKLPLKNHDPTFPDFAIGWNI